MKTILVPTDFSVASDSATQYAFHLAKNIGSDVMLCHAVKIAMETPVAPQYGWVDYEGLKSDAVEELEVLSAALQEIPVHRNRKPVVEHVCEIGSLTDIIKVQACKQDIPLLVMGTSGAGSLSRFFLGSTSRDLIDAYILPTLLVPANAVFSKIRKIAFATDMGKGDAELIAKVAELAKHFEAEILIVNITDNRFDEAVYEQKADEFLKAVSERTAYPEIYFRHLLNDHISEGLYQLTESGMVDMIVMVHRRHDLLEQIFKSSQSQKMARRSKIPLLVFPPVCKTEF